jgi:hypothetical protein
MTMTRCPLCRARLSGANSCARCGADLTLALTIQGAAARHLQQAMTCLAAGKRHSAAAHADQALRLHRTPLAETITHWLRAP